MMKRNVGRIALKVVGVIAVVCMVNGVLGMFRYHSRISKNIRFYKEAADIYRGYAAESEMSEKDKLRLGLIQSNMRIWEDSSRTVLFLDDFRVNMAFLLAGLLGMAVTSGCAEWRATQQAQRAADAR